MDKKTTPAQEKEYTLSDKIITDYFYCDGKKIVVLDSKAFKGMEDRFILAQLVEGEKEDTLEPLTEEEYEKAVKKYNTLVEALNEEEDYE